VGVSQARETLTARATAVGAGGRVLIMATLLALRTFQRFGGTAAHRDSAC